jgi:hypothetical protein
VRNDLGLTSKAQGYQWLAFFSLLLMAWGSHSNFLFNGLASQLLFVCCAFIVVSLGTTQFIYKRRALLLYALWAGWVVLVDYWSGEFLSAFARDMHWLVLPLMVSAMAEVWRNLNLTMQTVRLVAAICILFVLSSMFAEAKWHFHWRQVPILGHIRHLGLTIGFFVLMLLQDSSNSGWHRLFYRAVRIIGLAMVIWSGTRASFLALALALPIYLYLSPDRSRRQLAGMLLDLALAIVIAALFTSPGSVRAGGGSDAIVRSFSGTSADALSSMRFSLWRGTFDALINEGRLWIGAGGNGFARLQVLWGASMTPPGHIQPHNVVVQMISDWGLPGFALFSAFSVWTVGRTIFSGSNSADPTSRTQIGLAGLVYLLVTGMLDATLYHLEHLVYLSLVLGMIYAGKARDNESGVKLSAYSLALFLVLMVAWHAMLFDHRIGLNWYFPTF